MQKDQKPIEDFMIRNSFTEIIYRCICIRVMIEINNMREQTEFTSIRALTREEKTKAFNAFLRGEKAIKHLNNRLNTLVLQKDDLITEILKLYEMEKHENASYDHDLMGQIFLSQIGMVRELIGRGNYGALTGR